MQISKINMALDYVDSEGNLLKKEKYPNREFRSNIYALMKKRWKMMSQYDIMIE